MAEEIWGQFDRLRIDLTFQYGQARDDLFELVVSAEGIRERIPQVRALVDAAPKIAGWRVIAFRPLPGKGGSKLRCRILGA